LDYTSEVKREKVMTAGHPRILITVFQAYTLERSLQCMSSIWSITISRNERVPTIPYEGKRVRKVRRTRYNCCITHYREILSPKRSNFSVILDK